jgi:dimethylargininase
VLSKTLEQHDRYCEALRQAGLNLVVLAPDPALPDSTFVEDAAVVTGSRAMVTRPGARSRRGETVAIRGALSAFFERVDEIEPPGTVDGGDVCEADERAVIGLSQRTNRRGADQLAEWFRALGKTATIVDISDLRSVLHLKSGMAYVGDGRFVVIGDLAPRLALADAEIIAVDPAETYAANCVRVNSVVLVAQGYPRLRRQLERCGFDTLTLDVSEFRKMDGGLSCLSIRF